MHRSGRYASLREGLVGAWCPSVSGSFGYSLRDLSGYGNHGALTNMDPPNDWVANGGKMALDFDGSNDWIQSFLPSLTNVFCTSYWFKHNSTPSSNSYPNRQTVNTLSIDQQENQINYSVVHGSSQVHLTWTNANTSYQQQTVTYTPSTSWTHAVAILDWDRDTASFWANGVLQSISLSNMNLNPTTFTNNSTSSGFGRHHTGNEYFNGMLDDIRIWNRSITPSEIQLLYSGGRGVGLIPERRRWFYQASSVFTGSASLTTGAATASGSATFTKPVYTGTSAVTTAATTCSGSATFTAPTFTAASSVTIAAASCSATGTFVKPVYTATSVLTVGAATASGAATFVAPVYTASASVAVGATVVNVAGSVVSPTFTGTAAVSVGAAVASGTASNNFVDGPYRVAARQVFVPGAVAFQVRTTGASAAQVF